MSDYRSGLPGEPPALLLGYAQLPEAAIRAGVLLLAGAAIAPTEAAISAMVDRASPAESMTEAFAWLATARAVPWSNRPGSGQPGARGRRRLGRSGARSGARRHRPAPALAWEICTE
jgi:hypothetical protein